MRSTFLVGLLGVPGTFPELIGSAGVLLLLVAFFLNLFGLLSHERRTYQVMNAVGAGLSCYASYLIDFMPFVVLEGTWCIVAIAALVIDRIRTHVE